MKKKEPSQAQRCGGMNQDGTPCSRHTNDPSGFCADHKVGWKTRDTLTQCSECMIQKTCQKADIAPKGVCYYELYEQELGQTLDGRTDIVNQMEAITHSELRHFRRFDRELSGIKLFGWDNEGNPYTNAQLYKEFYNAGKTTMNHLEQLARMKGIQDPGKEKDAIQKKVEAAKAMFHVDSPPKKTKQKEEELTA